MPPQFSCVPLRSTSENCAVLPCFSDFGCFPTAHFLTFPLFLIGGKYKPLILWHLIEKPLHYMELQRLIPKATPKMLSQQLRDLEECGMIHREVIPEKPPKTLYSLTAFGKSIIPVLDSMCNWGIHFLEGLDITPPCGSKL